MVANDEMDTVEMYGCAYGVDWNLRHENGKIKIVTESGKVTIIDKQQYKQEVYRIADEIEMYYKQCKQKVIPDDSFKRDGHTDFWNEWHSSR